jgi:hypothetical protein
MHDYRKAGRVCQGTQELMRRVVLQPTGFGWNLPWPVSIPCALGWLCSPDCMPYTIYITMFCFHTWLAGERGLEGHGTLPNDMVRVQGMHACLPALLRRGSQPCKSSPLDIPLELADSRGKGWENESSRGTQLDSLNRRSNMHARLTSVGNLPATPDKPKIRLLLLPRHKIWRQLP